MNEPGEGKQIIVGVTGASGAAYARRLIECLCDAGVTVHLVVTPNGKRLMSDELGLAEVSVHALLGRDSDRVIIHPYRDVGSTIASGRFIRLANARARSTPPASGETTMVSGPNTVRRYSIITGVANR